MNRRRRYAQCLANIDRLERELFPHLYKRDLEASNYIQIMPGAIWQVNDPTDIHTLAVERRR